MTIFLTPLLTPTESLGYEQVKVLFFIFSISFIGLIWLYLNYRKQVKINNSPIFKTGFIFILMLLLTSIIGVDPVGSFIGEQPYLQGFVFYSYLFFFYMMVSSAKLELKPVAIAMVLSAMLVSLISIEQYIRLNFLGESLPTYAGRVVSSFGQPNFYSGFLLLCLPLNYYLFKNQKGIRWLWALIALVLAIGIIVSESRAAILLMVTLILGWFIFQLNKNVKKLVLALSAVILVLMVFVSVKSSSGIIWLEIIEPQQNRWLINNSPEKRIFIWPVLIEQFIKRPIIGYGLENLNNAYGSFEQFHEKRSPAYYGLKQINVDRSHNYLIDLLIFGGVVALVSWLVLVKQALLQAKSKGVLLSILLVYLVWIQFQNQSIVQLIFFWLILALIDHKPSIDSK